MSMIMNQIPEDEEEETSLSRYKVVMMFESDKETFLRENGRTRCISLGLTIRNDFTK